MAIITLPTAVRIRRVEWNISTPAQVNRSKWTQRRQVVTQPGPTLLTATAEIVVMIGEVSAREGEAFLVDLEGSVNSFRLRGSENDQVPVGTDAFVNGAGQSGRTLNLRGGVAGAVLSRGMKVTLYDQMVFLMADTTFASDGTATLTFKPSLRLSPADGAYIELVRPKALMALAQDAPVGWAIDPGQLYQFKPLQLEEAF